MRSIRTRAVGWTDWNLCLDRSGGPNWAGNVCDAPILIDTAHSTATQPGSVRAFYKQPMYYYLGHVAAFTPPHSVRLGVTSNAAALVAGAPAPVATAFLTPEGDRIVVVIMNRHAAACEVAVHVPPLGFMNLRMAAHSIRTLVLSKK